MRRVESFLRAVFGKDSPANQHSQTKESPVRKKPGDGGGDDPFAESDPYNPFPDPVRLEISDVFDLHSIPPRDVKRAVIEFLHEARTREFKSVRIIHGKGVGVQRELVRSILAGSPFVIGFSDAPPDAGGWGATVAHLSVE